jgi:hypothetical protein
VSAAKAETYRQVSRRWSMGSGAGEAPQDARGAAPVSRGGAPAPNVRAGRAGGAPTRRPPRPAHPPTRAA